MIINTDDYKNMKKENQYFVHWSGEGKSWEF